MLEEAIITALPQLGVAGASIIVMYLMYKDAATRLSVKDETLMKQVNKHEGTLREHQSYMKEIHTNTMIQLNHASKVIEDNIRSHERVISMLDKKTI